LGGSNCTSGSYRSFSDPASRKQKQDLWKCNSFGVGEAPQQIRTLLKCRSIAVCLAPQLWEWSSSVGCNDKRLSIDMCFIHIHIAI
jgi:hypothetical protein